MTPARRMGIVRIDGKRVGEVRETDEGFAFVYDAQWVSHPGAVAISLTMPVRSQPYLSRGLHPFFENLLPEGWLLEIATTKLKIAKDDSFGLLIATCVDCIGAVEVVTEEAS